MGYGYLRGQDHPAWIARLAVSEKARNRGVGGQLMSTMIDHCRSKGAEEAILYVMQDNDPAVHLYRKYGFRVKSETCQYLAPAEWINDRATAIEKPSVRAVPIDSIRESDRPDFPAEWAGVPGHHNPPHVYVFVYLDAEEKCRGFSSFSPTFPGCFPFVVENPQTNAESAIASLAPYLAPEKDPIRLTFSSAELAAACDALGLKLNYTLYKMVLPL